jgi:cation transport ATPase
MKNSSQLAATVLKVLAPLALVLGVVSIALRVVTREIGVPEALISGVLVLVIAAALFGIATVLDRAPV